MSAQGIQLIIALDNIRSHHNVGSVFRSADAFSIEEIILGGISPRPPHRDIQKTALGATESVPWRYEATLSDCLSRLKRVGYTIVSMEQDSRSISMSKEVIGEKTKMVLVLGNEVDGVSTDILDLSDEIWEIPQTGIKKSLNVSVCAGISMHHIRLSESA